MSRTLSTNSRVRVVRDRSGDEAEHASVEIADLLDLTLASLDDADPLDNGEATRSYPSRELLVTLDAAFADPLDDWLESV